MPVWLRVKPVNTPNASSGMRASILPPKMTSSVIATTARKIDAAGDSEPDVRAVLIGS